MNFGFLFKGMSSTVKLGKKCIEGIGYFLEDKFYIKVLLVFVFFVSVFSLVYMSLPTVSSGDDHFFHIRFAEAIRQNGFFESFQNFKSIYFSKHAQGNEYFIYYNFLFYLALVPFTYISPLFLGIKLYAIFAVSLASTIFYWCLKKFSVKYPFIWLMVVFSFLGTNLFFRFFLSRPYTLAPVLLLLLLYFLSKKEYIGTFLISLIYLFWHSATFYFTLLIITVYYIFERFYGERGNYRSILWGVFGTTTGLLIITLVSHGFFLYIINIIFGVYKDTIIGQSVSILEGNELYKADFFDFIKASPLFFSVYLLSIFVFIYQYVNSKIDKTFIITGLTGFKREIVVLKGALFFLSSVFFVGMMLISRRFQDFFVFFGAMFVCLMLSEIKKNIEINNMVIKRAFHSGFFVVLCYLCISNLIFIHDAFASGVIAAKFNKTGIWINKNINEGEVIYNVTWNWFPQLYYHSPKYNYVIGLEPRFLYEYSHELYWKWSHISGQGFVCITEVCEEETMLKKMALRNKETKKAWYTNEGYKVANVLVNDFKTHYVVTSKDFVTINELMDNNDRFEKVFNDNNFLFIYKVN